MPKNRRGDIHSSLSLTPTAVGSYRRPKPTNNPGTPGSEAGGLDLPPSSSADGPTFSAPPAADEPDELRAIWGTTVNLGDTMKQFREFLRGFKPKYRAALDKERGTAAAATLGAAQGDVVLYETYLRRLRTTGETDLNLDVLNLLAFPPARRLHVQICKYPQEVIPAFDQVLKDLMLELAEEDQAAGALGMRGVDGEEVIAEISGKVYKIRPYGLPPVNMRELNPQGACGWRGACRCN
jgi:DNA replication licensing factor MCM4